MKGQVDRRELPVDQNRPGDDYFFGTAAWTSISTIMPGQPLQMFETEESGA